MTETAESLVYAPFVEADANADATTLRELMREQGYLFFRALIPSDDVLAVRKIAVELCREAGWLDPDHEPMEAYASPQKEPTMEGRPDYMPVYRKLLHSPLFHDFPTNPALLAVAAKLLNLAADEVLVHPRRIGRITFPHLTSATTPAHQDHFYIRGSVETYSCWTPLGECSLELGGLAVVPGSYRKGFLDHSISHAGAVGGQGVPVDDASTVWHTSDFGLGDALFFHSYTIHKALPNITADRLRISTDNRYQRPKEDIHPDALRPHYDPQD